MQDHFPMSTSIDCGLFYLARIPQTRRGNENETKKMYINIFQSIEKRWASLKSIWTARQVYSLPLSLLLVLLCAQPAQRTRLSTPETAAVGRSSSLSFSSETLTVRVKLLYRSAKKKVSVRLRQLPLRVRERGLLFITHTHTHIYWFTWNTHPNCGC